MPLRRKKTGREADRLKKQVEGWYPEPSGSESSRNDSDSSAMAEPAKVPNQDNEEVVQINDGASGSSEPANPLAGQTVEAQLLQMGQWMTAFGDVFQREVTALTAQMVTLTTSQQLVMDSLAATSVPVPPPTPGPSATTQSPTLVINPVVVTTASGAAASSQSIPPVTSASTGLPSGGAASVSSATVCTGQTTTYVSGAVPLSGIPAITQTTASQIPVVMSTSSSIGTTASVASSGTATSSAASSIFGWGNLAMPAPPVVPGAPSWALTQFPPSLTPTVLPGQVLSTRTAFTPTGPVSVQVPVPVGTATAAGVPDAETIREEERYARAHMKYDGKGPFRIFLGKVMDHANRNSRSLDSYIPFTHNCMTGEALE